MTSFDLKEMFSAFVSARIDSEERQTSDSCHAAPSLMSDMIICTGQPWM